MFHTNGEVSDFLLLVDGIGPLTNAIGISVGGTKMNRNSKFKIEFYSREVHLPIPTFFVFDLIATSNISSTTVARM